MIYKRSQKSVRHSSMLKNQSRIAQPSLETLKETHSLLSPKKSIASIPNKAERESIRRSLFQQSAGTSSEQVVQRTTTQSSNSYDPVDEVLTEYHQSSDRDAIDEVLAEYYQSSDRDAIDEVLAEYYQSSDRDAIDEVLAGYHQSSDRDAIDEVLAGYHQSSDRDAIDEVLAGYHQSSDRDAIDEVLAQEQEPLATAQSSEEITANSVAAEHSKPEKKAGWFEKAANAIFIKKHNTAAKNTFKDTATTATQAVASTTNSAAGHSGILTHSANLISGTVNTGASASLSGVSAFRSGRQAFRAYQRSQVAQNYADKFDAESTDEDSKKLAAISQYMAQKQRRRAKWLGSSAGLSSAATVAGIGSVVTGVATPPGLALGAVSLVFGGASSLASVVPKGKGLYKRSKGTKGKNRKANATELYELAKKGHEPSLQFLLEPKIGVLQQGTRPHMNADGFYAEDLQDESKRKFIIKYIQQKMRS